MKRVFMALLCCTFLSGCGLEPTTIEKEYEGSLDQVTKIEIVDGSTGELVFTEEKEEINQFIYEIKEIVFNPDENQEKREGFLYSIHFYENSERTFHFSLNTIGDHYYETEPELKIMVEQFFHEIKDS